MRILLFFTFIPFLAAVVHDLYINYYIDEDKLRDLKNLRPDIDDFLVSDLGWVWNEYAPNGLEALKDSFAESTWDNIINPLLQMPTMLVSFIPFAAVLSLTIAVFLFHKLQDISLSKKTDGFSVYKGDKANAVKYKKK